MAKENKPDRQWSGRDAAEVAAQSGTSGHLRLTSRRLVADFLPLWAVNRLGRCRATRPWAPRQVDLHLSLRINEMLQNGEEEKNPRKKTRKRLQPWQPVHRAEALAAVKK